ncbi:MAG: hypothetical protein IKM94_01960 [Alphaproteobacteria bacterium]|nr:hypothetical protein [Alphaproteobacteria bacterium]
MSKKGNSALCCHIVEAYNTEGKIDLSNFPKDALKISAKGTNILRSRIKNEVPCSVARVKFPTGSKSFGYASIEIVPDGAKHLVFRNINLPDNTFVSIGDTICDSKTLKAMPGSPRALLRRMQQEHFKGN